MNSAAHRISFHQLSCTIIIFVLLAFYQPSHALICYENNENGEMYEVSNSTWDYCVIIPSSSVRQEQGRLFGVGPDADWTKAYDNAFGISDNVYKILTLCLLEKYNFGFMTPNEHDRVDTPEYMFRCVCNYDLCNSATNFSKYLSNIMDENYVTLSSR